MPTGLILFYLPERDYGYVRVPDTREEFYFRGKHCRTPVRAGDRVHFQLREGKQGYYADEIERAKLV